MTVDIGDILLLNYRKFDNTITQAYFVVIRHESYDLRNATGFTAVKICSNPGAFQIRITPDDVPFLKHESYINCLSQFYFDEAEVIHLLGVVPQHILRQILTQIIKINNNTVKQLQSKIGRRDLRMTRSRRFYNEYFD